MNETQERETHSNSEMLMNETQERETQSDLGTKIGLAIFSFLLGLLTLLISNIFFADRLELAYSIVEDPLIVVNKEASSLVGDSGGRKNASRFTIRVENVGDLPVKGFSYLLVFNEDAEIRSREVTTEPRREVPVEVDPTTAANEIRLTNVTLDRTQAVNLSALVEATDQLRVEFFPASTGAGTVVWTERSGSANLTLEGSLSRLVFLWILVLVVPPLLEALPQAVGLFFFGIRQDTRELNRTFLFTVTGGQLIAKLLRFYLLFLMLEPAIAVVRAVANMAA